MRRAAIGNGHRRDAGLFEFTRERIVAIGQNVALGDREKSGRQAGQIGTKRRDQGAVSYTHLDVYKRQLVGQRREDRVGIVIFGLEHCADQFGQIVARPLAARGDELHPAINIVALAAQLFDDMRNARRLRRGDLGPASGGALVALSLIPI